MLKIEKNQIKLYIIIEEKITIHKSAYNQYIYI